MKNKNQVNGAVTSKSSIQPRIDFAVGGQAVIEGVMMRSPHFVTVAVRKNKGDIKLKQENFRSFCLKAKFFNLPIIRGVINLFEMMIVGMRILNYSANELLDQPEKTEESRAGKILATISFAFSIIFALALSLLLFKFLPLWLTDYLSKRFEILNQNYLLFNLVDGLLKTTFFVVYIALLGLTANLKRVFQYHGAEHKSIFTYEQGLELTVENARTQTRFHPRCGTSFILVVFLISIFIYTFVPRQPDFLINFFVRAMFLPIIAGVSYEILKWSAKQQRNLLVRMITAPGLWFQRLTTSEPDDQQLAVALEALKKAIELEEQHMAEPKLKTITA